MPLNLGEGEVRYNEPFRRQIPVFNIDGGHRLELHSLVRTVQLELPELQNSLVGKFFVDGTSLGACSNQWLGRARRPSERGRSGNLSQANHGGGGSQLSGQTMTGRGRTGGNEKGREWPGRKGECWRGEGRLDIGLVVGNARQLRSLEHTCPPPHHRGLGN